MLTKENASGFNPAFDYPTYEYISNSGKGIKARCDGSRMIPNPKGHREVIRFLNEQEHFEYYIEGLIEEHRKHSNRSMKSHPYGIFIGQWRNARWFDEAKRRGLVQPTVV